MMVNSMEIIEILKQRFQENPKRHLDIKWEDVEKRLLENPSKLNILTRMEETSGEVDVIMFKDGYYYFVDCAKESPISRRSLCYDKKARLTRKKAAPTTSVMEMLETIGSELLDESLYQYLQSIEDFDLKTSSWILTPVAIRDLNGALFCDKRYNHCFTYHNSADSYYSSRGFRTFLKV